jgi:hypothetical protein
MKLLAKTVTVNSARRNADGTVTFAFSGDAGLASRTVSAATAAKMPTVGTTGQVEIRFVDGTFAAAATPRRAR